MLDSNFKFSITKLRDIEGIGEDHEDLGGETFYGIVRKYHENKFHTWPPVWDTEPNWALYGSHDKYTTVQEFYLHEFWLALDCDKLPFNIADQLFMFGVNAGVGDGKTILQRAISACNYKRLKIDGDWGPKTMEALGRCSPRELHIALISQIEGHYRQEVARKPSQAKFIEGWINRRVYGEGL
jgi:lysozyme family protein